jgi:metal-responsive CopG/Arc/MetJ family transcriptional regulator
MDAIRTERVTVNLAPDLLARLDRYAQEHRWTRSTAIVVLIERGLDAEDRQGP